MIDLSSLRRYDQEHWYSSSDMEECSDGAYVRYEDLCRLLAEATAQPVGYVVRTGTGAPFRTNQGWTNGTAKLYKSQGTARAAVKAVYPTSSPPGMVIVPVFAGVPVLYRDAAKAAKAKKAAKKRKR